MEHISSHPYRATFFSDIISHRGRVENAEPTPAQKTIFEANEGGLFTHLVLPRQKGATTALVILALEAALETPRQTIMVLSSYYDGMRSMQRLAQHLTEWCPAEERGNSMAFRNGSTIQFATASEFTGRGRSLTHVYWDLYGYTPNRDAVMASLTPALVGGKLLAVTTTDM